MARLDPDAIAEETIKRALDGLSLLTAGNPDSHDEIPAHIKRIIEAVARDTANKAVDQINEQWAKPTGKIVDPDKGRKYPLADPDDPSTWRYAEGYEWPNARRQWFVYSPRHPHRRNDGFVARARLVMEILLDTGVPHSHEDYAENAIARANWVEEIDPNHDPGYLLPQERVYHIDMDPENDHPDNLMLFKCQRDLIQHRSALMKDAKRRKDKGLQEKIQPLTEAAKEMRERRRAAGYKGLYARRRKIFENRYRTEHGLPETATVPDEAYPEELRD